MPIQPEGWPERLEDAVRMSGQFMADGKCRSGSAVLTRGLVEDVGEVMGDRFLAQPQLLGDLAVGQPSCHQT